MQRSFRTALHRAFDLKLILGLLPISFFNAAQAIPVYVWSAKSRGGGSFVKDSPGDYRQGMLRVSSPEVNIEFASDLSDASNVVLAGFHRDMPLSGTAGWEIVLPRAIWVPLRKIEESLVEIALPPGFPVRSAQLTGPFDFLPSLTHRPEGKDVSKVTGADPQEVCLDSLYQKPNVEAPVLGKGSRGHSEFRFQVEKIESGPDENDFVAAQVVRHSFRIRGFLRARACGDVTGRGGGRSGCGAADGSIRGRKVRLRAGAQLFADAGLKTRLALFKGDKSAFIENSSGKIYVNGKSLENEGFYAIQGFASRSDFEVTSTRLEVEGIGLVTCSFVWP